MFPKKAIALKTSNDLMSNEFHLQVSNYIRVVVTFFPEIFWIKNVISLSIHLKDTNVYLSHICHFKKEKKIYQKMLRMRRLLSALDKVQGLESIKASWKCCGENRKISTNTELSQQLFSLLWRQILDLTTLNSHTFTAFVSLQKLWLQIGKLTTHSEQWAEARNRLCCWKAERA